MARCLGRVPANSVPIARGFRHVGYGIHFWNNAHVNESKIAGGTKERRGPRAPDLTNPFQLVELRRSAYSLFIFYGLI